MDIRQDNDEHDETEMGVGNTVNTNELGSIFTPLMIQECSLQYPKQNLSPVINQ